MTRVGFCGLGVMGYPMAGHLASAGHSVSVYNRTSSRADAWVVEHSGTAFATPREVAAISEIVMLCVGNDSDVRAVVMGPDGVLAGAHSGLIVVDHTTTSAELAREISLACAAAGVGFVDAPVSGGQAGAINGALTVMCGADSETVFADVAVVAAAYSRSCVRLGNAGSGQLAKMVNQICIAGVVQGLAEGLAFATKAGLDAHAVIDVISKGAAQSWQMENRGHTMVDDSFDFGFAVEWMIKDLGFCVEEAQRNGAELPVADLVLGFYRELYAGGAGRLDTSSLIRRLP
ncbi:MAG: NAD(P)-dependent oxidoreductase [Ilumatobacteraceae bacterium]|jgi:3-hydroxyisobutyrate dehydrogenase|nr:NAD(P)-dependent oxidoreductase [Ilumatobacteraceae bacterium]